jgi:hypothetical protein
VTCRSPRPSWPENAQEPRERYFAVSMTTYKVGYIVGSLAAASPRATNTWTALPASPLRGRADPVAVWTGRQMIVWGGQTNTTPPNALTDGAVYTPTR